MRLWNWWNATYSAGCRSHCCSFLCVKITSCLNFFLHQIVWIELFESLRKNLYLVVAMHRIKSFTGKSGSSAYIIFSLNCLNQTMEIFSRRYWRRRWRWQISNHFQMFGNDVSTSFRVGGKESERARERKVLIIYTFMQHFTTGT